MWQGLVFAFGVFVGVSANPIVGRSNESSIGFDWNDLKPSTDLDWVPCYQNVTCTRLEVPLDYDDPSAGTTALAFLKLPAEKQPAKDILFNPGGPGTSGVHTLYLRQKQFRDRFGPNYNIIGFDPRGVNNSGPSLSCFPSDPANQNLFDSVYYRAKDLRTDESISQQYATAQALGRRCTAAHKASQAKYAGTVAVANDMLRYIELAQKASGGAPESAKLNYYGASYGTILGSTFATLFPDRIERMILDGVADAERYYSGTWNQTTIQADDALRAFFKYCADAGSKSCAFYNGSAEQIESRFDKILANLRENPLAITDEKIFAVPVILTASDMMAYALSVLYAPLQNFPPFAQALSDLESRNGTLMATLAGLSSLNANFTANPVFDYDSSEVETMIACLDANGRFPLNKKSYREYTEVLQKNSVYFGNLGDLNQVACSSIATRAPSSQQFRTTIPSSNQTGFPILFASNAIDPVTPLLHARRMSERFPGSAVLVQNAVGHTTFIHGSECMNSYFQAYLDGKLPSANTICEPDTVPFRDADS